MLKRYAADFLKTVLPAGYYGKAAEVYNGARNIRQAAPFIGIKHYCPCCGWYLRKFLPFGVVTRPNARCPRCWSLERHRLLWLYLKDRTNLFTEPLRLLHFAPEAVFESAFKSLHNLDYITADLDSSRAMVKADITDIPYEDYSFDVILCSHVLEHVNDDRRAMSELFRILRPGGWAIFMVPISGEVTFEDPSITAPEDRERYFGQWDHVRVYGADFADRLESAGFDAEVVRYTRELGERRIRRYGLPESDDIFLCTKPLAKSIE